ncbi:acyltransferase family protein [Dermatobacter hominis]|uniref:acyltransferase family protein n=1 Tax=Dermatobacter hominis TaxID=2884263 RepID=UPI001D10A9F1|nr:acyltransferase family protein [Dermatobacter hominis]UDY36238.1 acyltransferase [Dermatobacter hominis]
MTDASSARLSHLPGLDGLRGVAVVVVVAFHAGFERMVGGYLGVSTFFTLSGFLITSLLLNEARRTDTVALRSFWGRRFRRLLPAALVTLAAVVALFGPLVATADQRLTMRGDVLASLFDVANWHDILTGNSYAELFTAPSPVLHFWSLSIEEQFYLFFPLILLGLWVASRGRRAWLAGGLATLAVASVLEPFVFDMSDDRIYFGTDTRAAELLLGALLAVLLSHEPFRRRLALRLRWRSTAIWLGAAALAVQAWWWWSLPQTASWLYRGGFALYAVLTCTVITAAALPSGPMRAVMSWAPLRWIGGRSYGIYLIHWPIFLTVRQLWPDLDRWTSTILAVSITVGLAILSYRFVEQPVRAGRWPAKGRAVAAGALSMALVAAIACIPLPVDEKELATDFDKAQNSYDAFLDQQEGKRSTTTSTAVPTAPTADVAVFGDSTALGVGMGFGQWSIDTGRFGAVRGDAKLGCGVTRFKAIRVDMVVPQDAECAAWPQRWGQQVAATTPDIAMLVSAVWEVPDAQLPGSSKWTSIGDPAVDDLIRNEFIQAVDVLSSQGALVVLVTWPAYGSWADDGRPDAVARQADPARMARFNQILGEVAAARPDATRIIDLAGWMGDRAEDPSLRADGTHFYGPEFERVSDEWFGPELERIWKDWWRTYRAPGATGGATSTEPAPTTTVRPAAKKD